MTLARIRLVHTNDLHSHFDQWPHTVTLIRRALREAEAAGIPAAYLDAGDHLDMSEQTTYLTTGRVNLRLLEDAGCRGFTLGNNEVLRVPFAELTRLAHSASFPWFAANMRVSHAPLEGLSDFALIDLGPVRVGLFGMVPMMPAMASLGLQMVDELAVMQICAAELRAAGAHIVVHLSHKGIDMDRSYAAAEGSPDLIIGGHSHTTLHQPDRVGTAYIAHAGEFGQHVGTLDLEVDLEHGALTRCDGRLLAADPAAVPPDPGALRIITEERAAAASALDEVLALLPAPLDHDPVGDSRLGPVLAELLRRNAGAEVGLTVGGQSRHGFPAGPLTRRQTLEAMTPLFIPARLEMPGRQIQALLEQSEEPACHGYPLYDGGMRPRGLPVGRIYTAGLTYTVSPTAPPGDRIRDLRIGGAAVEPDRLYTVGAQSLLAFKESGYPAAEGARILKLYMATFVRELFEAALRGGTVTSMLRA